MRGLFLIICSILSLQVSAQTVSYLHKPLAGEGCHVKCSASWQAGTPYIVVTIRSDRFVFNNSPEMLLKLFNGEIIKLQGEYITSTTQQMGIVSGNIVVPISTIDATAQFQLTSEQMDKLQNGVAKIRISTLPTIHEHVFKNDKIGKKLYLFLKVEENKENEF